jgi:tetraacyldisaccharide 4'-kinase
MPLLPDAEAFKRLVDGSTRGLLPAAARGALAGLAVPYALAVAARNAAYDRRLLPAARAHAPVVSVGNLTLGGTGKTPLVAWVAGSLAACGRRPAIVSRGYGARRGERSDEAAELGLLLPGVPHLADRDRVAAARRATAGGADVVVLDDGFQHRRLARDLDIVAVDATDPFGGGRIFPRGLLREPLAGLGRAQAVVLTRATSVDAGRRAEIRSRLADACRAARVAMPPVWAEARHRPVRLRAAAGPERPLESLAAARLVAFAGIGNPAAFRGSLESCGADLAAFQSFPDHHRYTADDLEGIGRRATGVRADLVVTTLKDLVKIDRESLAGVPLFAVEIALDILAGQDALESLLGRVTASVAGERPS